MFASIRAEAHLPSLKRIRYRTDLQELTCTAAERDHLLDNRWTYKTYDPSLPSAKLRRVAFTPVDSGGEPPVARFAVAVWPLVGTGTTGKPTFVVGLGVYMSAWWEFFDNTFTDDVFYKNDWKRDVSSGCKQAR